MLSVLALSLALALPRPSAPAEKWVQVQSESFVVKSSVGVDRAKRVLRELETFRQLLGTTVVFHKVELPELPIEVLLIGDEVQLTELAPEYNGQKVRVAGYYQRGQDRDFIVLSANSSGNLTHVVYHELTHYFLSRSLESRPTWLNEGLAEYFATASIDDENIYLGGLSPERMEILRTGRLIPLKDFFTVDDRSPYYNETTKANAFYAQAWAFTHFMMHGPYKAEFKRYIEALTRSDARFEDFVTADLRKLDGDFDLYMKTRIRMVPREKFKANGAGWTVKTPVITDADVELAIAEIFISGGDLASARRHLEKVAGIDDEFPRASYYKGVLARMTGEGDPKEFFIDALMDLNLGPRAAVHLVQLRELGIPGARRALEQAAAGGTHMADVYWALSDIYLADARKADETVRLMAPRPAPVPVPIRAVANAPIEAPVTKYAEGKDEHFRFDLLSVEGKGPAVVQAIPPPYPPELLNERLAGSVVMDIQVSEAGEVAGVWLVAAQPEIFSGLATGVIREWKFQPEFMKIRVIFHFVP